MYYSTCIIFHMLYISHVIYFIWLISLEITRYTICYSSPVFVGTHLWAVWRAPRGRPPVATSRTPGSPSRVAYGGSCHGKGGKSMGNLWEIDDFWEIYGLSLGNLWEIDDFLGNRWFSGKSMIFWEIYDLSLGNLWFVFGKSIGNLWFSGISQDKDWLVVEPYPSEKWWSESQLVWWNSQSIGK